VPKIRRLRIVESMSSERNLEKARPLGKEASLGRDAATTAVAKE